MLDFDIEWLFEEVYRIRRAGQGTHLNFLSDWDVQSQDILEMKRMLAEIYLSASKHSFLYNYSFEQFSLKEQILDLLSKKHFLEIKEDGITITASATSSIYLVFEALTK